MNRACMHQHQLLMRPWRSMHRHRMRYCAAAPSPQCKLAPPCASAKRVEINQRASLETQSFWEQLLKGIHKPNAKRLIDQLDLSNPMGVRVLPGRRTGKAPLYPYFLKVKHDHPRKIVLVRVGEFYETMGTDAVLLVQHAGLNPMGQGIPPRAGCPIMNLRKTLSDLVVEAGIPTVVCEEVPDEYLYGQRKAQKTRFIAGVVTPAQPHYMHGLVDGGGDVSLEVSAPLMGISASVGGYQVMEVNLDTHTCTVMEGLTEDAVSARIHKGGMVPPLYIHKSAHTSQASQLSEASFEAEWMQRVADVSRAQVGLIKRFSSPDPLGGLLELVKLEQGLQADTEFQLVKSSTLDRPKPLFLSTAQQLGIHRTRGVPSLLDSLLSADASLSSRHWLKRLLLLPPPTPIAHSIARACSLLSELQEPLPSYPTLSSRNVVLRLSTQEASADFFRDLVLLLEAVGATCSSPSLTPLAEAILDPVMLETGMQQDAQTLHATCQSAMEKIAEVIQDPHGTPGSALEPEQDGSAAEGMEVLALLFQHNEQFQGKVQGRLLQAELTEVESSGQAIETELQRIFVPLSRLSFRRDLARLQPCLVFDKDNNAVWLKIVKNSKASEMIEQLHLVRPHDRNGKLVMDRWSSEMLEQAMNAYRAACMKAVNAVRRLLCNLANSMQADLQALVTASTFAVIAMALENHVREAARRAWNPAKQMTKEQCLPSEPQSHRTLHLKDMWPYWFDARSASVVTNDISMSSMFLLTGPNMAGKSTILRSLCAVALLGACGLLVPAASAQLPYTDTFILRNFAADSPLEGRSSFAVEMIEMRYVLEDAGAHALVLIDELGKGTEVKAGTAIAGAMLEQLHNSDCRGAFATHLHQLLELPLEVPRLVTMMMETRPAHDVLDQLTAPNTAPVAGGVPQHMMITGRRPTWKMVPGVSTESLALDVALQWRVPPAVVHRAADLLAGPQQQQQPWQSSSLQESMHLRKWRPATVSAAHEAPSPSVREQADSKTVHDAAALIRVVAASMMHNQASSSPANCLAVDLAAVEPEKLSPPLPSQSAPSDDNVSLAVNGAAPAPVVMRARQHPPPSTVGCSCVYVVRRQDGWFYCGQTDDLKGSMLTVLQLLKLIGDYGRKRCVANKVDLLLGHSG